MTDKYLLQTGEPDKERLRILSRLYNPGAIQFLQKSGVSAGMTVLEIGCGAGYMACDLARLVGPNGKVLALDNSESQLTVAKQTATQQGIDNIEFIHASVFDLDKLGLEYDATYGRWVLEFSTQSQHGLELMYGSLKPGGILAYEASDIAQTRFFSLPHNPIIDKYFTFAPKMFEKHGYPNHFASEDIYPVFLKLNCKSLKFQVNQAMLVTPEDKKVYRLGIRTAAPSLLANHLLSQEEIEELMQDYQELEQSQTVSGFYPNLLISGIK